MGIILNAVKCVINSFLFCWCMGGVFFLGLLSVDLWKFLESMENLAIIFLQIQLKHAIFGGKKSVLLLNECEFCVK